MISQNRYSQTGNLIRQGFVNRLMGGLQPNMGALVQQLMNAPAVQSGITQFISDEAGPMVYSRCNLSICEDTSVCGV